MSEPENEPVDPRRLYSDDGELLFVGSELADMTSEQRDKVREVLQEHLLAWCPLIGR